MPQAGDAKTPIRPAPLVISRRFAASRERVFAAWSSAEQMKRWFSPEGCTVPLAEVDFRPDGVLAICMRMPDGEDFWSRGHYIEIKRPERLVFKSGVEIAGAVKFTAHTTVTFAEDGGGTLMTVRQEYEIFDDNFRAATEGAAEGWRTTLDKLERAVQRSVVHDSFTIERVYKATPAAVFRALSDPAAKAQWFAGGEGSVVLAREMEVRPGGREHVAGRWTNGTVSVFDAVYFDVVPDRRLVYAYEMTLNGRKISASLATIEIAAEGEGTRLIVTEHGAFLDGYDDAGARAHGTAMLLDRLGAALQG